MLEENLNKLYRASLRMMRYGFDRAFSVVVSENIKIGKCVFYLSGYCFINLMETNALGIKFLPGFVQIFIIKPNTFHNTGLHSLNKHHHDINSGRSNLNMKQKIPYPEPIRYLINDSAINKKKKKKKGKRTNEGTEEFSVFLPRWAPYLQRYRCRFETCKRRRIIAGINHE